jgi:APA family basic amino acid/polyamine antiporter
MKFPTIAVLFALSTQCKPASTASAAAITSASAAPFADFVNIYAGTNAGTAIAAIGAISALGALNGWIMCQAELPAALARDGLFPEFMGKAAANGTPRNAHVFSTSLLTLVILMNSSRSMSSMFEFLILLTTAIVLVMYFGCAAAAFRLMTKGQLPGKAGFKVILLLAALYSCWTIYGAGAEALIWGVVLLLAGFPVFWLLKLARGSKPIS